MAARDIGIDVVAPKADCSDPNCPFHGSLRVRGHAMEGQVVATKMERSARVEREYLWYVPKYERYEKRTSSYNVHAPPCLDVQTGDRVRIMECRPISKTKAFVVIESKRGALRIQGEDATVPAKAAGQEEE